MWKWRFPPVLKDQADFGCSSKSNTQALEFPLCNVILMGRHQLQPVVFPNERVFWHPA